MSWILANAKWVLGLTTIIFGLLWDYQKKIAQGMDAEAAVKGLAWEIFWDLVSGRRDNLKDVTHDELVAQLRDEYDALPEWVTNLVSYERFIGYVEQFRDSLVATKVQIVA